MSVIATPSPVQRTIDRSTEQPMPNYDPEPVFSSGGCADELSARGHADGWAERYRKAHLEADADDLACEVDALRTELDSLDWSAQQFHAYLRDHCPGLTATCSSFAYVHCDCLHDQPPVSQGFEARARFPDGSPLRHVRAESWRELAALLEAECAARRGLSGVPLVDVGAA